MNFLSYLNVEIYDVHELLRVGAFRFQTLDALIVHALLCRENEVEAFL